MPKNPLKFARRKSSVYACEEPPTPSQPAASSFRVLERPEKINLNGDDTSSTSQPVTRPFSSPIAHLRAQSTEALEVGTNRSVQTAGASGDEWMLKRDRGSGGTIRSGSSYYGSSAASVRHSSTSTLPSSVDADKETEDEELFPRKTNPAAAFQDIPLNDTAAPAPPSSFTTRAAQALSFAQKHSRAQSIPHDFTHPPTPPRNAARSPERHTSPRRERAMTTSSYASTAKPETTSGAASTDLGDEFGYLFERPRSAEKLDGPTPLLPPAAAYHRTESPPIFTPRTQSRTAFRNSPDPSRDDAGSPYAWDRRNSRDRLMSISPVGSPALDAPPLPPPHKGSGAPALLPKSRDGYALVPERQSPIPDRFSSDSENDFSQPEFRTAQRVTRNEVSGSAGAEEEESLFNYGSRNATPRANRTAVARQQGDSLFDSSPSGPPSRAIRPGKERENSNIPKKMTKAQFERLQRSGDPSAEPSGEDEAGSDSDAYEDEDEADRARRMNRQRQRQEANMSVYRQQMKKVTGGGSTDLPSSMRPSYDRSSASAPAITGSTSSVHLSGLGGTPPTQSVVGKQSDDDDDDVPLGILQAHGFPRSSRPASRSVENDAVSQRLASSAGSVVAGGASPGNLPPFARNLPADPYFGAGVVRQSPRESLGLSGASVYRGAATPSPPPAPSMGHPGGLVGVIAGEERAKAARRGSHNPATAGYGPTPPHMGGFPGMQQRSVSTGSLLTPQTYSPSGMGQMPMMGMPMMRMPMMPQMSAMLPEQQQQMQQFMQMQMDFMQNMMAMQQQQQMGQMPGVQPPQPPQPQRSPDFLSVPTAHGKRLSTARTVSQAPSVKNAGRATTMLNPPAPWNASLPNTQRPNTYAPSTYHSGVTPGYSPSIAPSERSNIGQPSRYRPVTLANGRTASMTSSAVTQTNGSDLSFDNSTTTGTAQSKATIRAIDKPKGTPRVTTTRASADYPDPRRDEEEEEDEAAWAAMRKKREEKKEKNKSGGFRFGQLGGGKGREISTERLVQNLK